MFEPVRMGREENKRCDNAVNLTSSYLISWRLRSLRLCHCFLLILITAKIDICAEIVGWRSAWTIKCRRKSLKSNSTFERKNHMAWTMPNAGEKTHQFYVSYYEHCRLREPVPQRHSMRHAHPHALMPMESRAANCFFYFYLCFSSELVRKWWFRTGSEFNYMHLAFIIT